MELKIGKDHSTLSEQPSGVTGRYCSLLNYKQSNLPSIRQFFDIYNLEGNHLLKHTKDHNRLDDVLHDASYRAFPRAVEFRPYNDANLIRTIQKLVDAGIESQGYSESWSGDHFCFAQAEQSERGTEMVRVAHDRLVYFLKALRDSRSKISHYRQILKQSHLFHDIDSLITNSEILEIILMSLQITPDMSGSVNENGKTSKELGLRVSLPHEVANELNIKLDPVKTHCHLTGNAISEFFVKNNLQPFVQELLVAAQIFEYSSLVREVDRLHFGSFPTIKDDNSNGLYFYFNGFHHPQLLRKGQKGSDNLTLPPDIFLCTGGDEIRNHLIKAGLLEVTSTVKDNFSGRKEQGLKWSEGICLQLLQKSLAQAPNVTEDIYKQLITHFESNVSESFGDISLGEINPATGEIITVIVLPSPNMAGKSTSMKAIGLLLQEGLMARRLSCEFAEMTIPDQIYHNFNVEDDISEQRSTFKAQLENISDFLLHASTQSLGLFDELFNGTSSDYQLALAWAFLETCSEKKLRVIISTHNRELEFFSDPDGYDRIQGSHSPPSDSIQFDGSRNAKILSIGHDRKFKSGSERDSEAMVIADEVLGKAHDYMLIRAREILEHIRSSRS